MKQIALCVAAALLLFSCSKQDNSSNTNPDPGNPDPSIALSDNETLVVGSWKLVRVVDSVYTGTTLNDVNDGVPYPCVADNILTFNSNRTYEIEDGADTCLSGSTKGQWKWAIVGENFNYEHGPGTLNPNGKFRRIDNNNFAVWAHNYWHNNENTIKTFYYKRN